MWGLSPWRASASAAGVGACRPREALGCSLAARLQAPGLQLDYMASGRHRQCRWVSGRADPRVTRLGLGKSHWRGQHRRGLALGGATVLGEGDRWSEK